MFLGVLASRASEGQEGESAQGLNRMGAGIAGGSGQLESIEGPGRCSGRCSGGQTEVGEQPCLLSSDFRVPGCVGFKHGVHDAE